MTSNESKTELADTSAFVPAWNHDPEKQYQAALKAMESVNVWYALKKAADMFFDLADAFAPVTRHRAFDSVCLSCRRLNVLPDRNVPYIHILTPDLPAGGVSDWKITLFGKRILVLADFSLDCNNFI